MMLPMRLDSLFICNIHSPTFTNGKLNGEWLCDIHIITKKAGYFWSVINMKNKYSITAATFVIAKFCDWQKTWLQNGANFFYVFRIFNGVKWQT